MDTDLSRFLWIYQYAGIIPVLGRRLSRLGEVRTKSFRLKRDVVKELDKGIVL